MGKVPVEEFLFSFLLQILEEPMVCFFVVISGQEGNRRWSWSGVWACEDGSEDRPRAQWTEILAGSEWPDRASH